ncbi:hypothetical protein PF005_g15940 [Phytophthora fragariae]|uniref:Uncharacterized protein n=1 Tax=Phytophthora fragariae TaxID=53985 RepID=A0A6A3EIX0_9STRA|nr:hypothetical protein PF003_g31358 [Phytophthora fragariae]KAE8932443.1 hypothetical protein PF009_g17524 [Phytophthora fragariae]KAE8970755.1 hypothetical protein PF011_g26297 [Phytophthora fragariae]KAE9098179.1 hypothetical protein PF007_g16361 [Phytophthora fragariae]KAE9098211.1 hypothetical protein PF010_g15646 [Phytophthora fragariae]
MRIVTAGALSASSDAVPHDEVELPRLGTTKLFTDDCAAHIKVQCNLVGVCSANFAPSI